jgi:putative secretion ATPase (PEP-CTERM system associated)
MYERFYGFSGKPFQLSPDPRFFFASKIHKRAYSYLEYGLSQAEGFIVITGPIGSGKSTLARNLQSQLDHEHIVAAQLVTTTLGPDELLLMIASAFGLSDNGSSKAALLTRLEEHLRLIHRQGKRAVLVVDEAQNLPGDSLEELRMLSNFQVDDKPLLQSFLLGQEELKDALQAPNMEQFRQRIIASCHLTPLTDEECREYIEHRLTQVGWMGFPSFTDDAYHAIHAATLGIPRKINVFCDRLLLMGYLEELECLELEHVNEIREEFEQERQNKTSGAESAPAIKPVPGSASPDATLFRQHLEEVFHYLDKTLADKLKALKHVEGLLQKKYSEYRELSSDADSGKKRLSK